MAKKRLRKKKAKHQNFWVRQLRLLRFYLVTGILVWIPLIVTVWITWWLFTKVGVGVENLIRDLFGRIRELTQGVPWLAFLQEISYRPGMGFGGALMLFLLTGILTRYLVGRRLIGYGEKILAQIPIIRNVYRAVQQIRDVFVNREGTVFQDVCVIEYPRENMYAVAFVTSEDQGLVQEASGKRLISVFMPSTPNPTTGFLLYLPEEDVMRVDVTVEDAMKLVISGGAYMPERASLKSEFEEDDDLPIEVTPSKAS